MNDKWNPVNSGEAMSAIEFEDRFLRGVNDQGTLHDFTSEAIKNVLESSHAEEQKDTSETILKSAPQQVQISKDPAEYNKKTRHLYEEGFGMITHGLDLEAIINPALDSGWLNKIKGAISDTSTSTSHLNLFEAAVSLRSKKMVGWLERDYEAKEWINVEKGDFLAYMGVMAEDHTDVDDSGKLVPFFYRHAKTDPGDNRLLIFERGDLSPEGAGLIMVRGLAYLYYRLKGLLPDEPTRQDVGRSLMVENGAMLLAADYYLKGRFFETLLEILKSLNLKTEIEAARFLQSRTSSDFIRARAKVNQLFIAKDNLSNAELYVRDALLLSGLPKAATIQKILNTGGEFAMGKKIAFMRVHGDFNGGVVRRTVSKGLDALGLKLFMPGGGDDKK